MTSEGLRVPGMAPAAAAAAAEAAAAAAEEAAALWKLAAGPSG